MRRSYVRAPLAGAAVATMALGAGLVASGPALAQQDRTASQVSVVHGIPGQQVDVYLDGEPVLEGFAAGEIAGPLELPAGSYDVALTAPGGDPDREAIVRVQDAEVPEAADLSLVAHLDEGGEPTLTPFTNDLDPLAAGEAAVTVRHTAAAPAVDVRAGGERVFTGLTNPNGETAVVDAGTVPAEVVLAGTGTVVLGPTELDLAEGTATIVYATGSADDGTLDLVVQTVDGLHSPPTGVPSGTGALATAGFAGWWYGAAALGILLLVGGALWVRSGELTTSR